MVGHESMKQPIRTRYLGHVPGYQPIREKNFIFPTQPGSSLYLIWNQSCDRSISGMHGSG